MGETLEVLTTILCVLGLTGAAWWLMGRTLRPLPCEGSLILLRGRGDGGDLEQIIRGFIWLRSLGVVRVPILIADVGLNERGRALALELAKRWPGVILWPADDLKTYLTF